MRYEMEVNYPPLRRWRVLKRGLVREKALLFLSSTARLTSLSAFGTTLRGSRHPWAYSLTCGNAARG